MSREKYNESSEYDDSEYDTGSESESDTNSDSQYDSDGSDGQLNIDYNTDETVQTDNDGYIILEPGQKFGPYVIGSVLGEGAFGRVFHARNRKTGHNEALKIGKNCKVKRQAAKAEIIALTIISCRDHNNESLCMKMLNWFNYNGHICIAFPMLGLSVYDFMKNNNYKPFSLNEIRHISYQLCTAVSFLHKNGMTHTDLKPENMVFVNSSYTIESNTEYKQIRRLVSTNIRLIDFGNVTRDGDYHYQSITTTHYRAPEVILNLGWSHPCDVWSIGCTLYEIYCGYLLFTAENSLELLAMMERTLGPIPGRMTSASNRRFIVNGKLNIQLNEEQIKKVEYCKPLKELQLSKSDDHSVLFDLIKCMLEYDPTRRITLKNALLHSFFMN